MLHTVPIPVVPLVEALATRPRVVAVELRPPRAELGRRAGMDDQGVEDIEIAARLHDLGKLAVPDVVLQKRARLSPAALDVRGQHELEGYQLLSAIGHPLFGLAGTIAWAHHEWWDGSGYPRGIRRTDIPESARSRANERQQSYQHRTGAAAPPIVAVGLGKVNRDRRAA